MITTLCTLVGGIVLGLIAVVLLGLIAWCTFMGAWFILAVWFDF